MFWKFTHLVTDGPPVGGELRAAHDQRPQRGFSSLFGRSNAGRGHVERGQGERAQGERAQGERVGAPKRAQPAYHAGGAEPALEDLLSDPVTKAVMKRDSVETDELQALLTSARGQLKLRKAA
ncbi:MAG: hypothetical protein ACPGOV_05325 [Magnetovibrionaceae bacterium]